MSRNYTYEQIPLDCQSSTQSNLERRIESQDYITILKKKSTTRNQERAHLEDTFNLNEDRTEEHSQPLLRSHTINIHIQSHINDGVFSNISAKPESNKVKEEIPPSYEEASADAAPSYWQTTVITPSGISDVVLVEGLPIGSIISFLWNLMVSTTFQFVGFLLTYLLHTSHAAKDGSRAGLGVSLIQYGFYVKSRGTLDEGFDYDGEEHEIIEQDGIQVNVIAYFTMVLGWFLLLRSVFDYIKARKMEKIITAESMVVDEVV